MHDGTISQTVADRATTELAPVAEQLEMLAERVGMHGRDQEQVWPRSSGSSRPASWASPG